MNRVLYCKGLFKSSSRALRSPASDAGGRASSPRGASAEISVETASNSPRKLAAGKKRSGGAPVSEYQTPSRAGTVLATAEGGEQRESGSSSGAAARSVRLLVEVGEEVEGEEGNAVAVAVVGEEEAPLPSLSSLLALLIVDSALRRREPRTWSKESTWGH